MQKTGQTHLNSSKQNLVSKIATFSTTKKIYMESIKFFVLNIDKETLKKSLDFLSSKGFEADGETDPENALALFQLKNYDMAVFGGGISGKILESLKKQFLATNKELEIIEHTSHPAEMYDELVDAFKD